MGQKKGCVMMSALAQGRVYTLDDIFALPDDIHAELIDGQMYNMPPSNTKHQRIVSFLHLEIGNYIRANERAGEVFLAPFAVFLFADDKKYLEPDISVIRDVGKVDDRGCNGAPDWIIEIVSPSSRSMDYYTKLSLYQSAGVKEYWIVDSMKQTVLVYDMEHAAAPVVYSFADRIKGNIYNNLKIDFSKLQF